MSVVTFKQNFRMIDVGRKRVTHRRAVAVGTIRVGAEAFALIAEGKLPKGNVLALAEMAGIMGAKNTPNMIPLCHTLPLDQVEIHTVLNDDKKSVTVYAQVAAHAKTGVEMEALAAVNAALLTVYDLTKGVQPVLELSGIRLLVKEGGKSGLWFNPEGVPDWLIAQFDHDENSLKGMTAAVVVMSDRASKGEYQDKSGALLAEMLQAAGANVVASVIIPDDRKLIADTLRKIGGQDAPQVGITSGGTGLSVRDVTPEALTDVCDRMIPGFGELLRRDGACFTDLAWLSRSTAGMMGKTLVIALPGSPKAVKEGMEALLSILPHALSMACGGAHPVAEKKGRKHV